ncbi:hypothetical protein GCM10008997_38310 [Halomonas salifodinae]
MAASNVGFDMPTSRNKKARRVAGNAGMMRGICEEPTFSTVPQETGGREPAQPLTDSQQIRPAGAAGDYSVRRTLRGLGYRPGLSDAVAGADLRLSRNAL